MFTNPRLVKGQLSGRRTEATDIGEADQPKISINNEFKVSLPSMFQLLNTTSEAHADSYY